MNNDESSAAADDDDAGAGATNNLKQDVTEKEALQTVAAAPPTVTESHLQDGGAACSVCSKEGPFSKRQLKLIAEQKPARCATCIDNKQFPAVEKKEEAQQKVSEEEKKATNKDPTAMESYLQGGGATCTVCSKEGPFSKRQLKLAAERKPARCTACIDNKQFPVVEKKEEKTTKTNIPKKEGKQAAAADSSEEPPKDTDEPMEDVPGNGDADVASVASSQGAAGFSPTVDVDEDSEDEVEGTTSLHALKQQILGRQIRTMSDQEDNDGSDSDDEQSIDLRKELSCAICHDLLHQPVSLHCGHSFCHECFHWWMTHSRGDRDSSIIDCTCPTCRASHALSSRGLSVNTALRACVRNSFGVELKARRHAERDRKRQATRGEQGGAHSRGYEELKRAESVISFKDGNVQRDLSIKRSILLDADDQRMQFALAVCAGGFNLTAFSERGGDKSVQIVLALLTMEEDEVEDGGFPWMLGGDNDDNDALVASHIQHSFIEARARPKCSTSADTTSLLPLARRAVKAGEVIFVFDRESLYNVSALVFRDEKTGTELEITMPSLGWNGIAEGTKIGKKERFKATSESDESENEGDFEEEEEDDGFIVDEADEEGEDDDPCCICRKGGELMVCDGGDLNIIDGCGRSFHIECVGRDEVPPGDWVCEVCAIQNGMDVGLEGHEFPATIADDESGALQEEDSDDEEDVPRARKRKKEESENDDDQSSEDKENEGKPPQAKKRMVILDDSSDDE